MSVAVIADTHGLLRENVYTALGAASLILHAGDVGRPDVLRHLEALAPVRAIRGNVDRDGGLEQLPETLRFVYEGRELLMVHRRSELETALAPSDRMRSPADPSRVPPSLAIFGHSHKPALESIHGVLCLNPGSIGPRRFRLPISMAWIRPVARRACADLATAHGWSIGFQTFAHDPARRG